MRYNRRYSQRCHAGTIREYTGRASTMVGGSLALLLVWTIPTAARAQQSANVLKSLVFNQVTVVDVEQGKLVPGQRVVVTGNRIHAVGNADAVTIPKAAQVVDARGKYLIPGLWDMHVHPGSYTDIFYPLLIANGVTGIRDAGSNVPLDVLRRWRREILAGTRTGPPRQILSGPKIEATGRSRWCPIPREISESRCISNDLDSLRRLIDSIKAAGADMIKLRTVTSAMYFAAAAEARRVGIPFGGHLTVESMADASDSGASIIDHVMNPCQNRSLDQCRAMAEQFRRNGTWLAPTLYVYRGGSGAHAKSVFARFRERIIKFHEGSALNPFPVAPQADDYDSLGFMYMLQRVDFPILAGPDMAQEPGIAKQQVNRRQEPGFATHGEMALFVAYGMTPLAALRTATLNPAKYLRGTDSLGTVTPGKLADLVLLDANPLTDIAHTTTIRAVVANGRYFDRAALNQLLAEAQAKAKQGADPGPLFSP